MDQDMRGRLGWSRAQGGGLVQPEMAGRRHRVRDLGHVYSIIPQMGRWDLETPLSLQLLETQTPNGHLAVRVRS